MPLFGEIAKKTRDWIPTTWAALIQESDRNATLGEEGVQDRINQAKWEIFRELVDPNLELSKYGPIGTEYAAVVAALKLIPAGYDHWMAAATSWGTSAGQNNNKTFIDRASALLRLRDEVLIPEERRLYALAVDVVPGIVVTQRSSVMLSRDADPDDYRTPDPYGFEDAFERPRTAG